MSVSAIPTSVEDPKLVAQRRNEIINAAMPLFVNRGFAATRIKDIAAAMQVNVATLYQYIRKKEDILTLIHDQFQRDLTAYLDQASESSGTQIELLRELFLTFLRLIDRHRSYYLISLREMPHFTRPARDVIKKFDQRLADIFQPVIEAGVASGEFYHEDPALLAHTLVGLGQQWVTKRWLLQEQFGLKRYGEAQWSLVVRALTAPPATRYVPSPK